MAKHYDRAYFDRWYRGPQAAGPAALARKAALALSTAAYHLGRPVRTVLDIGCGEGAWRAPLRRLCPGLDYLGFDSSEYAIRRFGPYRNLHRARFGDFARLRPCPPVDLLICADVLHYLPARELDRGLPGLAALCGGVAYLECWTREDAVEGDLEGFLQRPAAAYRRRFEALGLRQAGSHCWLAGPVATVASALEVAPAVKDAPGHCRPR